MSRGEIVEMVICLAIVGLLLGIAAPYLIRVANEFPTTTTTTIHKPRIDACDLLQFFVSDYVVDPNRSTILVEGRAECFFTFSGTRIGSTIENCSYVALIDFGRRLAIINATANLSRYGFGTVRISRTTSFSYVVERLMLYRHSTKKTWVLPRFVSRNGVVLRFAVLSYRLACSDGRCRYLFDVVNEPRNVSIVREGLEAWCSAAKLLGIPCRIEMLNASEFGKHFVVRYGRELTNSTRIARWGDVRIAKIDRSAPPTIFFVVLPVLIEVPREHYKGWPVAVGLCGGDTIYLATPIERSTVIHELGHALAGLIDYRCPPPIGSVMCPYVFPNVTLGDLAIYANALIDAFERKGLHDLAEIVRERAAELGIDADTPSVLVPRTENDVVRKLIEAIYARGVDHPHLAELAELVKKLAGEEP